MNNYKKSLLTKLIKKTFGIRFSNIVSYSIPASFNKIEKSPSLSFIF